MGEDFKKPAAIHQPYAEEILCANWNPLVLTLAEPSRPVQPTSLDAVDVENLLARLYRCQQA